MKNDNEMFIAGTNSRQPRPLLSFATICATLYLFDFFIIFQFYFTKRADEKPPRRPRRRPSTASTKMSLRAPSPTTGTTAGGAPAATTTRPSYTTTPSGLVVPHSDVNNSVETAFSFIQNSLTHEERRFLPIEAKIWNSIDRRIFEKKIMSPPTQSSSSTKPMQLEPEQIREELEKKHEYPPLEKSYPVTVVRNTFSRVEYENGDVYEGEFVDGFRQGNGTYYFSRIPGTRYEGQFIRDEFHGYGVYFYERNKYEGEWVSSYKHRKGKFTDNEKRTTYEGDWREGFRHGTGTLKTLDFEYTGGFHRDNMHGVGTIDYLKDGVTYSGDFVENLRHGKGELSSKMFRANLPHSEKYTGEWADDLKHGKGVQEIASVGTYTGDFCNGKRHGQGEIMYVESQPFKFFKGSWADDMKVAGQLQPVKGPLENVLYEKNIQIRREVAEEVA
ncbi:unnamed protein product [Amoebophrya sp. A120]|nr:unnamed protein product [Amoebophrya sp. A120]|eukprot:GSA120T00008813001.1